MKKLVLLIAFALIATVPLAQAAPSNSDSIARPVKVKLALVYLEDFSASGQPTGPPGSYWYFVNSILPSQDTWQEFIPGDGYARINVDSLTSNDTDTTNPYQLLGWGGVSVGHRIAVRMKGAVVPGLTGFIFTYQEESSTFDEIDIELVADDTATAPSGHATLPPSGWTDARFNSYGNSSLSTYLPETSIKQPLVNADGVPVSHIDDAFHVYVIDWYANHIDFWVDSVKQATITSPIPDSVSEVLIGFRDLSWAGAFNWSGTKTMTIDWMQIERLPTSGSAPPPPSGS